MMPHVNDLKRSRDKVWRDLNRSVLLVLALILVAGLGIIWSLT